MSVDAAGAVNSVDESLHVLAALQSQRTAEEQVGSRANTHCCVCY